MNNNIYKLIIIIIFAIQTYLLIIELRNNEPVFKIVF
jgi:hypothetical protein